MFSLNAIKRLPLLVVTVLVLSSCGKVDQQFMKGIKVETYNVESDVYISVQSELNLGAMSLPSLSLPINHPRTGQNLGEIQMGALVGQKNYLNLAFNLSSVTDLSASRGVLPNGAMLPLIGSNPVVEIPIGGSAGVKLYLSFINGAYALGVAVPIKAFDAIGSSVGQTSLFPIFNIDSVIGSAGLFTSRNSGQNGFGVFVDLTNIISSIQAKELAATNYSSDLKVMARSTIQSIEAKGELNYQSIGVSSKVKAKIDNEIYKLHSRKTRLSLH